MLKRLLEKLADGAIGASDRQLSAQAKAGLEAHRAEIEQVAREYGVPPALIAGLVAVESNGDPEARGPELGSGQQAIGLMQVLPSNLEAMGVPESRWTDPLENLRAGTRILVNEPEPLGEVALDDTLAAYGGFQTVDPTDYILDVETLGLRAARELGFQMNPPA